MRPATRGLQSRRARWGIGGALLAAAIILAAQYQCPARIPEATHLMVDALNQLPPTG